MKPTYLMDSVRRDHTNLCGELDVLKNAEGNDGPPSWQALRDVCSRLSLGLHEHILHEEQLLVTDRRSLGAAASDLLMPPSDHYNDYRYLQVITRHITLENRPYLLNNRYHLLTDFIRGLRNHMDEQEAALFPRVQPAMAHAHAEEAYGTNSHDPHFMHYANRPAA